MMPTYAIEGCEDCCGSCEEFTRAIVTVRGTSTPPLTGGDVRLMLGGGAQFTLYTIDVTGNQSSLQQVITGEAFPFNLKDSGGNVVGTVDFDGSTLTINIKGCYYVSTDATAQMFVQAVTIDGSV